MTPRRSWYSAVASVAFAWQQHCSRGASAAAGSFDTCRPGESWCAECTASSHNATLWWPNSGLNCPGDGVPGAKLGTCDVNTAGEGASKEAVALTAKVKSAEECCLLCTQWNADTMPGAKRTEKMGRNCGSWYWPGGGRPCMLKACERHACGQVGMNGATAGMGLYPPPASTAWGWPFVGLVLGAGAAYLTLGALYARLTLGWFEPPHEQFWRELLWLVRDGASTALSAAGLRGRGSSRTRKHESPSRRKSSKHDKRRPLLDENDGSPGGKHKKDKKGKHSSKSPNKEKDERRHRKSEALRASPAAVSGGKGHRASESDVTAKGKVSSQRPGWDYYNKS